MSEHGFYPNQSASHKRGSSLLRGNDATNGSHVSRVSAAQNGEQIPGETSGAGGSSSSHVSPVPNDQTVISKTPPMPSVNVTAAELGPFQVGDRLGVYELTEYIGGGGMGSVYKAVDTLLDRVVAIKILLPEAAGTEEAILRFRNEARSAARLDHESIAKVYYVGEAEGLPYLVFEFVDGSNIRDLVRQRGPLPLSDSIGVALQVADSLLHAGENGVVHRDVKPSNILLRHDGQVKLIDFGLARIVEVEERDNDLTASGVTLGTFDYISPEQARDPRTVDIRSDIYSLGCTLFYMLTGRPPFPEGTVLQKLLQHQGDRPPNVREFRPELPEEIALLLDRMLAKDPNDRFQTPAELREQIRLLAAQLGLHSLSFGVKNWTLPAPRQPSFLSRHLPWLLPVTALLVIVLGLDIYLTRDTQSSWNGSSASAVSQSEPSKIKSPFPELPEPSPGDSLPSGTIGPASPQASDTTPTKTSTLPRSATAAGSASTEAPLSPSNLTKPISPKTPAGDIAVRTGDDPIGGNDVASDLDYENIEVRTSELWGGKSNDYGMEELSMPTPYTLPTMGENGVSHISNASAAFEESPTKQAPTVQSQDSQSKDRRPNRPTTNGNTPRDPRSAQNTPSTKPRHGIITVGEMHEGSVTFPNLASACREASTGDIIELRYNGKRIEQPLTLFGKNLIIRAAKGYNPTVVFHPSKSEAADPDPILTPSNMLSLDGGGLTAIEVGFRLELDDTAPMNHWTLFEVQSNEAVQLEKCQLSVKNRSKQNATFFRVAASPSDELANGDATSIIGVTPVSPATIMLTDSIVRGNATFLRVDDERPVNCSWKNGLLVTNGLLLDVRGSETIWNHTDRVSVSLKHITAFAASGMCSLGSQRQGSLSIPVDYICYDSVILISNTNAMITQWINETPSSDTESLFNFAGDRNYYQGFDYFLIQKNPKTETDLNQLDFAAWQNRWIPDHETYSFWGWLAFIETPDASKPFDQRGPADYALSDNPENRARYAADDGSNLGLHIDRLPTAATTPSP